MLLSLRRLKHEFFMNSQVPRYAAYALGELLLVVLGILVALQIDNWNDDREERETFQSYLISIAGNIREDLNELHRLRETRLEAIHEASNFMRLRNKDRFEAEEIEFVNEFVQARALERYFSSNTSGYEALKNSGVLDRLQGNDLEPLLSRYYDTINQVSRLEDNHYSLVRALYLEWSLSRPTGLEDSVFTIPRSFTPDRFGELQPMFGRLINGPQLLTLAESQRPIHMLILHYDSLEVLGRSFIRMVEAGEANLAEGLPRTPIDDWDENLGFADVISNGRPALEVYTMGSSWLGGRMPFQFSSFQFREGELHIDYAGGAEWAAFFWFPAGQVGAGSPSLDFSRFSKLYVEVKGESGGETVSLGVKDVDYPLDRAPIVVELTLSEDWQSHEFDLAEFEPIDLTRVNLALSFTITPGNDPMSFSIRNAQFR